MLSRKQRKIIASIILLMPAAMMFIENASLLKLEDTSTWLPESVATKVLAAEDWVVAHIHPSMGSPTSYSLFFVVASGVLIVSVGAAVLSGWRLRGSGRNSIGVFFSTFLSRYFVGELAVSAYGLFIFVLFAVILTAWLPDALEFGNPWFVMGTIFYFLAIIFATAFAYPAPKAEEKSEKLPLVKHLVYGLSHPTNWNLIRNATCDDMKYNRKIRTKDGAFSISLFPLYASMHHQLRPEDKLKPRLEKVFLLVTNSHLLTEKIKENGNTVERILEPPRLRSDVKGYLRDFFEKAASCLEVEFVVRWPNGNAEAVGMGDRRITVEFVPIRDANMVKEIFKDIGSSEISSLIKEDSDSVSFHLTGGTAPMSIAMMLHAIKGSTHAEYAKQRVFNVKPEKLLISVDMDVFDLEDLVRELREYFERQYEKGN